MAKGIMKDILKIALIGVIFFVLFIVSNGVLPFSQGFKELNANTNPLSSVFILLFGFYISFTLYFITKHALLKGIKLAIILFCIMFFVQYVMTQIETLFFGSAFSSLTKLDIVFIMLAGLLPTFVCALISVKINENVNVNGRTVKTTLKNIWWKLIIFGIIYLLVYMLFGYFVAWQFEALRVFYNGSPEKVSFVEQLIHNFENNKIIYPFQILRGILFGIAIIPLLKILDNKYTFIASVCLLYFGTAIVLIIPNVLFPDMVRYGHLLEMATSMLVLGIIAGNLFWEKRSKLW